MLFNCALIDIMLVFGQDGACWMVLLYRERITSDIFRYFHSNFSYILMSRISCYWFINHWHIFKFYHIYFLQCIYSSYIFPHISCYQFNAMSEQCSLAAQCTCERNHVLLITLFYVSWECYDMTVTWKLYNYFSVPSCIIFLQPHLDRSPIQCSLSRGRSHGHTLSS